MSPCSGRSFNFDKNNNSILTAEDNSTLSQLSELQKELYDLSARNPFVNVNPRNLWFHEEEGNQSPMAAKLYKKAQFFKKEYALETALHVEVYLKWTFSKWGESEGKRYFISPLLYRSCTLVRSRKVDTTYRFVDQQESYSVNPILKHFFSRNFDVQLNDQVDDPLAFMEELSDQLSEGTNQIKRLNDFDEVEEWQFIQKPSVGIFNYKKSLLGVDYEIISSAPNESVKAILGDSHRSEREPQKMIPMNRLDSTQKQVLQHCLQDHFVVQGPPGTGKSHTIVSIITNYLANGKKVLFVSEKRSALDVVFSRLKEAELHHWAAYFNTEKDEKKTFYAHLKTAWEKAASRDAMSESNGLVTFSDFEPSDIFTIYPSELIKENEKIQGNLVELFDVLLAGDLVIADLAASGRVPHFGIWKQHLDFLLQLEEQLQKANKKTIHEAPFFGLNKSVFMESDPVLLLEKRLKKIVSGLDRIAYIQKRYDLVVDLTEMTKYCVAGSIMGMVNKTQLDLLVPDHKAQKSFRNLSKRFDLLKKRVEQAEKANKKWSKKPSLAEITELIDLLRNSKPSKTVFGLLRRRSSKLYDVFQDFDPKISDEARIQLLESVRNELNLRSELDELKLKLKHNLSIVDPEHEIDHISRLRNKLDELSQNEYLHILEHEESLELIQNLDALHPIIQDINNLQRFILDTPFHGAIEDAKEVFGGLLKNLPDLTLWQNQTNDYYRLPREILNFIQANDATVKDLHQKVAYANLLDQSRFLPNFHQLSGHELFSEHRRLVDTQKSVYQSNRQKTAEVVTKAIGRLEKLSNTPASKLKAHEKELKKEYRAQRRKIIHEIGKKQQHQALKDFFADCEETLLQLQPIWMMNPLAVSGCLPCKKDLFDLVIFDEASQIPLEDAIPAIYRSKQLIVLGDSEQMPPSRFFMAKDECRTLLDQAEGVLDSEMLKWHYRSTHPALIRFSNQHFYDNELVALPPRTVDFPIDLRMVEGNYHQGRNEKEAQAVADFIKKETDHLKEDIGVIAFSREQEDQIRKRLEKVGVDTSKMMIRNLENVQGVEWDHVIISIGYGKNEEGQFRMNFGPVNQEGGANRLNVLFSRAKTKMTIFSGVRSDDFKLSDNRGVQILKDFLAYIETGQSAFEETFVLPSHKKIHEIVQAHQLDVIYFSASEKLAVSAFIHRSKSKILIVDPGLAEGESQDIFDIIGLLKEYFKELKIVLSVDLWKNSKVIEKEIVDFFNKG